MPPSLSYLSQALEAWRDCYDADNNANGRWFDDWRGRGRARGAVDDDEE